MFLKYFIQISKLKNKSLKFKTISKTIATVNIKV